MSDTQLASMRLGAIETDAERIQRQKSGNIIFILDGQTDQVLDFIHRENVIENVHRKSLKDTFETFEMTVIGDKPYAQHLGKRNGLIVPGEDGELLEFRIFETVKYRQGSEILIDVYANATYLDLKKAKVYDEQQTDPMTAIQHATEALSGTEWQVGKVDFSGVRTLTFDSPFNPYTYLKRIASEFELELTFYITSDGTKVTGRYVDIVEQVGEWRGRTIEFGQDLQGIERKERQDIVTALYGYGPEREDGTRLKVFVEDEEALRRWGRHGRHLIDVYEPDSADQDMTEERLRQLTRAELDKRINTAVEYRADINDLEYVPGMENKKIRFGDTIRIKDTKFNPALYLEARVHTQERDVFNKNRKRIELGDFEEFTEEEVRAIWRQLQEQIRQKISQAELVEYAERKVQRDTIPPENTEHLWLDTSTEPNVLKRYDEVKADWVKATPTEADEVGAETPEGAQQKADEAKQEAISYSENFTINYAQKQITSSTTPPANPEIGDLWFDSSTQPPTFRRWNGSEWEKLSATTFEELEGMIDKDQLPDRVIDSTKLAIDAVLAENLAEGSVYAEAIQAEAVGAQAIAANAILAKHIAAGEVTANHLAADAVTADAIAAGAILAEHISANSITANHIKSLVGLNVNDQFIVDSNGNVKFAGHLEGASGTFTGEIVGGSVTSNTTIDVNTDAYIGNNLYIGQAGDATNRKRLEFHRGSMSHARIFSDIDDFGLADLTIQAEKSLRIMSPFLFLEARDVTYVGPDGQLGITNVPWGLRVFSDIDGLVPGNLYGRGMYFEDSGTSAQIYNDGGSFFRIRSIGGQHNGSIVINRNTQSVSIYQNGAFRHEFRADGSKSGGSIEHGGTVYGMSPVDSPRVILHDYLFNREIEGEKVFELDRTFADSMAHYDVLSFNPDIRVEVIDRYRFKAIGNGKTTFLIAGPRRSYEDIYWMSINPIDVEDEEEEGGNQIEH